ncbi:NPC intracellular cholesterol transporter 2 homolog a [Toxorhynchites rutilus septentrionalis]|uniref:NPC intracellular cholesterol transporter 2 homolog a n=1 Tax=Toxorhynchites rutilus septentrionalis TaxID=329112 RepID=UPI00247942EF|nr:NPC intracellular cholesterol transporter 2 homolog a [Toxorhynchites rutilus septentrionalis]XP_055641516.1 NPC intracellular cholesterol transporter 2 homolog a [Toxorhynchites rutilus septentrionalis]XP_055641525.1 NPC intracellular cholesterol transporter 2 homolog a [Toxorhynchites rutilus septentrionalis]XP_055641533.1 NPC intracellular cholesterol transporter 2 homolog a [Toxorhynchites rutilus septentrionalis]XP_055641543.1 NPC intracellular cholesterol transporter 2 homolog a [Toxor
MKSMVVVVLALSCLYMYADATDVKACPSTRSLVPNDQNNVEISNCTKGPCKLKRKTKVSINQKFTPAEDIKTLTTTVYAQVLSLPLPFVGVDGTNACDHIFAEDGETKLGCPLKAGVPVVYKREFPVLEIYPKMSLVVHWELQGRGSQSITCFEVPAKIV